MYKEPDDVNQYYQAIDKLARDMPAGDNIAYCWYEWNDGCKEAYERILDICKKYGIAEVHDIGCNYMFQAPMFAVEGVSFVGIDIISDIAAYIPKDDNIHFILQKYPCRIKKFSNGKTAAISNFCVGYLCCGEKVWKQIAEDHDYFIGTKIEKEYQYARKYFTVSQSIPFYSSELVLLKRK